MNVFLVWGSSMWLFQAVWQQGNWNRDRTFHSRIGDSLLWSQAAASLREGGKRAGGVRGTLATKSLANVSPSSAQAANQLNTLGRIFPLWTTVPKSTGIPFQESHVALEKSWGGYRVCSEDKKAPKGVMNQGHRCDRRFFDEWGARYFDLSFFTKVNH